MTSYSSSVSVTVNKSPNSDASRSKSCESVCTTNSSCYLQRRKAKNPLMYPLRSNYTKMTTNITNSVRQRVLSAKLLKLRSIQSQLNDANYHLSELSKENQILKNLQKRQDKALSKYENTNADLPRLIRSHEEQLRIITEKNKAQRLKIKELSDLLKIRDEELLRTQEKLIHLEKLNKDKRLIDREKMLDQIEDLQVKLKNTDDVNSILNRKLTLETKTAKQRLNNESMKYRLAQKDLAQALAEIDRLTSLLEARENVVHPRKNRFNRLTNQSISMTTLSSIPQPLKSKNSDNKRERLSTIADNEDTKLPVTNIKLEPIKYIKTEESSRKSNDMLSIPSEVIKNRLSSGSKSRESGESENCSELSFGFFESYSEEKGSFDDVRTSSTEKSERDVRTRSADMSSSDNNNKSSDGTQSDTSEERLENISSNVNDAIKNAAQNIESEFQNKLGTYCSDVVANVRKCSERLECQKKSLKLYKKDTDILLDTFEKTTKFEDNLKDSFNFDPLNDDFLKDILSDNYIIKSKKDRNGNVKKQDKFSVCDRKKLLNTLKAIDAGDSIEIIDEIPTHKFKEMDQIIG
ncbi:lebercilin-like protein [Diabrotica virgifera virgifera]|uniref:Lebercilin-like protein n=1 Tax=Diabrotica virgifera virgifera TaxID=50390 RepID=A0A6P7G174_DIAVI|nr:lebercilin-like protein [Diabrotica virgifera virgifera]